MTLQVNSRYTSVFTVYSVQSIAVYSGGVLVLLVMDRRLGSSDGIEQR